MDLPPPKARKTVWQLYSANLIRTQITILLTLAVVYFVARPHWGALAVMFVVLQVVAYMGVWWGVRAAAKAGEGESKLPLDR